MSKPVTYEQAAEAVKFLSEYIKNFDAQAEKDKLDVVSAIRLMDRIRRLKDLVAEEVKTPVEAIYTRLMFGIVPDLMTDSEMTNVTIDDVGKCRIQDEVTATAIPEKKEDLYAWLIDNELEDMITRQVNAQTLAAWVRQRQKSNLEIPNDCLKVKPVTKAIITRN